MAKKLADRFSNFVQSFIPHTTGGPQTQVVCIQCYKPSRRYLTATNLGYQLTFCSDGCAHRYWHEYGQHGKAPPAPRVTQGTTWPAPRLAPRTTCALPGCDKPCFVEGNKVHDYCGRSHAQQATQAIKGSSAGSGGGSGRTTISGLGNPVGPIYFYNRGEPYYEFTNFYEIMVHIDGNDWRTTEHYFQAQKFVGTPLVHTIRLMERSRDAFDKSRDPRYSHWRRSDWEEVKEDIMFKALHAKFTQHNNLRRMLLGTGDRELVERSPYDSYWGDGGDGSGKNRLGILLMRLRKDLKSMPASSL